MHPHRAPSLQGSPPPPPPHGKLSGALTLVAVESAPALLAVALPRLLAGAVQTPGVSRAPVAALSLPALPTRALAGGLAEAVLRAAARSADGWWRRGKTTASLVSGRTERRLNLHDCCFIPFEIGKMFYFEK